MTAGDAVAVNPFSTRCTRPGALPFIFPPHDSAVATVARFAALGWQAQIVGPHGVGKSTLLVALMPVLAAQGKPGWLTALRDGQRKLPADWRKAARSAGAGTILVDGYEQLNRWSRWQLRAACRREGWALLVTAHDDVGLPLLARLAPSLATLQTIVDALLGERRGAISADVVSRHFAANGGDLRESLFALYDCYEQLRLAHPTSNGA